MLLVWYCVKNGCHISNSPIEKMNFQPQIDKQVPRAFLSVPITPSSVSSGTASSNKTRIRWTPDLHQRFVECVNCLGGSESKWFDFIVYSTSLNAV